MGESVGINSGLERLAKLFEEDSENEATFYGFSDSELIDTSLASDHEVQPDTSSSEQEATSEPSAAVTAFRLRIALKQHNQDAEEEKITKNRGLKRQRETNATKKDRHVKSEDECESDSDEDVSDNFLTKREQNIKANKAMLAQLMADLQKMPGGAGFLKKTSKQKIKHPPRSGLSEGESRRNPERASRRQTRSMRASGQDPSPPEEADVKLSLEEELLEVRQAPRHRSTPRPKQTKPHIIRPVEDVTEDDLQLVADNMTDKVYNSFSGSTCHQCRQKTVDTKTCCRSEDCRGIQGQFCGPCLRNRYGEDVRKALMDPNWKCPPCRGICNCSFCRQREGRCPTGILFPLAQYHGFSDVHSYLNSLRNKLKEGEE